MTVKELKELLNKFPEDLECGVLDQEIGDWMDTSGIYLAYLDDCCNPYYEDKPRNSAHRRVVILG